MKENRSRFWIVPISIIVAALLICAVGLPFFWAALDSYETSTPLHGIRQFFDRLDRGDLTLADEAGFTPSEFATKQMYIDCLKEQFGSAEDAYLYARIEEEDDTDTSCRYDIYRDNKRLGTLRLTANTPNGPWTATAAWQSLEPFTVTAPAFVTVYLNGTPLGAAQETARETHSALTSLTDFVDGTPQTVTYTVNGLLRAPTVTAEAAGCHCTVTADGQAFTVTAVAAEAQPLQQRLQQVTHLYANYISQDAAFADLKPHMIANTPFYKSAKAYDNYWYNKHLSVEFANETISDIEMLSDNVFIADITFDYIVKRTHDTNTYPTAYRCLFVKSQHGWQLLDLKMQ